MKPTNDPLSQLEATKRQADLHDVLPQELKPCVAMMLDHGVTGASGIDPNTECLIVAVEFRRLEVPEDEALRRCVEWQAQKTRGRSMRRGEVSETVRTAYEKSYSYGCGTDGRLYKSNFCMGHDRCPYYVQIRRGRGLKEHDYFDHGWPGQLSSGAHRVYRAVVDIEARRQCPGGTTYASYRQIERYSGVGKSKIKSALDELQRVGLITYTPGKQGGRSKHATEIKRVIPIPEAPRRPSE